MAAAITVASTPATVALSAYGGKLYVTARAMVRAAVSGTADVVGSMTFTGEATSATWSPPDGDFGQDVTPVSFSGTGSVGDAGAATAWAEGTGTLTVDATPFLVNVSGNFTAVGDFRVVPADYVGDAPAAVFGKPAASRPQQIRQLRRAASAARATAARAASEARNARDPALGAALENLARSIQYLIDEMNGNFDWTDCRRQIVVEGRRSEPEGGLKSMLDALHRLGVIDDRTSA